MTTKKKKIAHIDNTKLEQPQTEVRTPWYGADEKVPAHLEYPDCSMVDLIIRNAENYSDYTAYEFMNTSATYAEFIVRIEECARALKAIGINEGDKVTICMPNTPQAIIMFYAINMVGAISNMVHPLSAEKEIEYFLNLSKSKAILTLDAFYPKVRKAKEAAPALETIIAASIGDEITGALKLGFKLTKGRKIKKVPNEAGTVKYKKFIEMGRSYHGEYHVAKHASEAAAILYSGGTTGTMKGILLTNLNFNALGMQTGAASRIITAGEKMLSIMPVFHGFGLGVGIHTMLIAGCVCHLVPQFSVETYAKLLGQVKPNYIAGVPTLYEALLRSKKVEGLDLSCLKGVFSGGDSLSVELKKKVDDFLHAHGANVQVREGYGLTECVTASCLTPKDYHKVGSIGIPFPDTYYKIVKPSTKVEVDFGEEGEICISGPSVMKGYLDAPEETASTLQKHPDGLTWLHTGDLGVMDEEGFIYFKQRLKRMIVSSGYSIYPSQLENVIDANENVLMSTVIGVPDEYKMQKVKAFVVLKDGIEPTAAVQKDIEEHCRKNIARYAMPYEFEYRKELPQTLVGKVAYTVLEKEEIAKQKR